MKLGAILTSARSLAELRPLVRGLDVLKVVTGWGLPWTPALRAEAARLCPELVVRTVAGDPSAGQPFPFPDAILDEVRPWWEARDPARPFWVELGNEPLIEPRPEVYAWEWQYWLEKAISACRAAFPSARLIAPAHLLNHPVPLGSHPDGVPRFLEICADSYRRCDAVGVHAYTLSQWEKGRAMVRQHIGPKPLWLTEFALNQELPPEVRGAAYRRTLAPLDAEAALLYHIAEEPGADPTHFNPNYTLTREAIEHLLEPSAPAPSPPMAQDTIHYPHAQVGGGFQMDVRQWKTVAAFRRHLAQYKAAQTAPWARGVTVHHSESPTPTTWKGVESMLGMARFYLNDRKWKRGPHIYVVSGARDPDWDGIWQLTPMNLQGVHAGECNDDMLGLEVVGSYNSQRWDAGTSALALGVIVVWLNWIRAAVNASTVKGHRDCLPNKTCPGSAIHMDAVRRGAVALLEAL